MLFFHGSPFLPDSPHEPSTSALPNRKTNCECAPCVSNPIRTYIPKLWTLSLLGLNVAPLVPVPVKLRNLVPTSWQENIVIPWDAKIRLFHRSRFASWPNSNVHPCLMVLWVEFVHGSDHCRCPKAIDKGSCSCWLCALFAEVMAPAGKGPFGACPNRDSFSSSETCAND